MNLLISKINEGQTGLKGGKSTEETKNVNKLRTLIIIFFCTLTFLILILSQLNPEEDQTIYISSQIIFILIQFILTIDSHLKNSPFSKYLKRFCSVEAWSKGLNKCYFMQLIFALVGLVLCFYAMFSVLFQHHLHQYHFHFTIIMLGLSNILGFIFLIRLTYKNIKLR